MTWIYDILFPLSSWLHVVCTTLIVGGTLFFELVLPIAIEDLKREQQLYVFARARLVWRWVVWLSVAGLLLSGAVALYRVWGATHGEDLVAPQRWAIAHVALGAVGMMVALLLTVGSRPPENPVTWMRLNLVVLLVAIFLGSATRHFQLSFGERHDTRGKVPHDVPDDLFPSPATQGTTMPATQLSTQPTTSPATGPTTRPAEG